MIAINNQRFTSLFAIQQIALGLERRFPDNNSPFAYGTRLCEEVGELVEALNGYMEAERQAESKHNLVKEIKDVLQIIAGLLSNYDLLQKLPRELSEFFVDEKFETSKENIIDLAICAGRFADAINHKESQGIKRQKRGNEPDQRLIETGTLFITCVCQFVNNYDLLPDLEKEIEKDYLKLKY